MNLFWILVAIVIISTVVGAVSKMLANLNEMNANANAARPRPQGPQGAAGGPRQGTTDMDRFLAEIDRLRKKATEGPQQQQQQQQQQQKPANLAPPVVQPAQPTERPRQRVMAELAEAVARPTDIGFGLPIVPTAPSATTGAKAGDLPLMTVVSPPIGTGAPATKVTRIANRPRPVAKTPLAKNLTTLLNSGQGLALAIVLQEILGPPKSKS